MNGAPIEALTLAALCGVSAHAVMGAREPAEIAERAADIAEAMSKEIGRRSMSDGLCPEHEETIGLRVDDTIARAVSDLVERVGALENELGILSTPAAPPPKEE